QLHFFDNCSDKPLRILSVINRKVGRITEFGTFGSEDSGKNRVKRTHPKIFGFVITHNLSNTIFHFASSFVGKGQSQNIKSINSLTHQISNSHGQYPSFSRACTCNNNHWSVFLQYGSSLGFVELVDIMLYAA